MPQATRSDPVSSGLCYAPTFGLLNPLKHRYVRFGGLRCEWLSIRQHRRWWGRTRRKIKWKIKIKMDGNGFFVFLYFTLFWNCWNWNVKPELNFFSLNYYLEEYKTKYRQTAVFASGLPRAPASGLLRHFLLASASQNTVYTSEVIICFNPRVWS